ncbi:MAG: ATP-dependent 6-phosphofructokinase [Dehalococcoidia bacterium]|nr:ATP-dependent 6-phosphofructokinase [Dehalococcoidia bacterium]
MKKVRIGVLTGGGDCAGLNPAIKWVVKSALDERLQSERGVQYEVVGIRDGWKGLVEVDPASPAPGESIIQGFDVFRSMLLTQEVVRTWDRYGGTFLGTSRTNPYNPKNDQSKTVLANIEELGLEAVIAIGGEDTLGVAYKLARDGVNTIGIPKTIDKDLPGTDYTLGFETALNVITEEVDRLRTTAGSHKRIFVVETMGRHAGWLALEGGESSGAYIILIPEHNFSMDKVNDLVLEAKGRGSRYDIIVVAEGAKPAGGGEFVVRDGVDGFGHKALGGIAEYVAGEIQNAAKLDTRSIVLSHLQRGGAPCAYDRRMGRYFGIAAIDLVVKGDFGKMVSVRNGEITAVPLEEAAGKPRLVDVHTEYDTDRYNGRRTILNHITEKEYAIERNT